MKTTRPNNLRAILLKHSMTDARDCRLEWSADFGKMAIFLYVPFISPALLLDFLFSLHRLDERFEKVGIKSAIAISNRFNINLCVEHGDEEAWYTLRVYKIESLNEKFDRMDIELTADLDHKTLSE
jgi:hypothetical protein